MRSTQNCNIDSNNIYQYPLYQCTIDIELFQKHDQLIMITTHNYKTVNKTVVN